MPGPGAATLDRGSLVWGHGAHRLDLAALRERVAVRDDDAVVVAGSLVDGYGNSTSDVDIYVIGETRPGLADIDPTRHHWVYGGEDTSSVTTAADGVLFQIFDYVEPGDHAWDVEYWTVREIARILAAVKTMHADLQRHGFRIGAFPSRQAGLLHRLLNGLVLRDSAALRDLVATVTLAELCYVLHRQYAGGYPAFRDLCGAWRAADYELAVHVTREHVHDQVMALTFLELLSNPSMKWLSRKLERLSEASQHIRFAFAAFNALPLDDVVARRRFVLAGMRLLDLVFERYRTLLDTNPAFMPTREGLRIAERDRQARTLPHAEFDRQMRYRTMMYDAAGASCVDLLREAVET